MTNNSLRVHDVQAQLGNQLRQLRLRENLDQRELAGRAGVGLNVVKRLEAGKGATVASLVNVLRALGQADWLNTLAPPVSISPLQIAKARTKAPRQRARKRRGRV